MGFLPLRCGDGTEPWRAAARLQQGLQARGCGAPYCVVVQLILVLQDEILISGNPPVGSFVMQCHREKLSGRVPGGNRAAAWGPAGSEQPSEQGGMVSAAGHSGCLPGLGLPGFSCRCPVGAVQGQELSQPAQPLQAMFMARSAASL
jgi:hypothetical protein